MARGSSRGGNSRGSSGRQQSSGNSKPSGRSTTAPKGQIKDGKAVQYAVKDKTGETKYIGSTNNPTRRAGQHQQSGKMQPGDSLEVQSKPISQQQARASGSWADIRAPQSARRQPRTESYKRRTVPQVSIHAKPQFQTEPTAAILPIVGGYKSNPLTSAASSLPTPDATSVP